MAFKDLTPEEQERVIIAELADRVQLFSDAGRSSMPIRLSEMRILLTRAIVAEQMLIDLDEAATIHRDVARRDG